MLVYDLQGPEEYEKLPIARNNMSMRYWKGQLTPFLIALIISLGIFYARWKVKRLRRTLLILGIFSTLITINYFPNNNSPHSIYIDKGKAPYQNWIDYVNEKISDMKPENIKLRNMII